MDIIKALIPLRWYHIYKDYDGIVLVLFLRRSLYDVFSFKITNLMIPVENAQLIPIDTVIRKHDNQSIRKRKNMLLKELNWCNEHASDICNTANVLYRKYLSGENFSAKNQCVDFLRLETECILYNKKLSSKNK